MSNAISNLPSISHGRPTLSAKTVVTVNVIDKNDAPVWTTPSSISISENPASGDLVYQVTASDEDVSAGLQSLTYSINSGNAHTEHAMQGSTGKLTVLDPAYFDYEGVLECQAGVAPLVGDVTTSKFIRAEPSMTKLACTQACSADVNCVGFMRATAASDSVSAECLLFSAYTSLASNSVFTWCGKAVAPGGSGAVRNLGLHVADDGSPSLSESMILTEHLVDVNENPVRLHDIAILMCVPLIRMKHLTDK